ncbi:MAG: peptidase T [Planctomycetaceae bacterium]|nr:peptidase T [Planctomycetaceae bacterium]
MDTERLLTRFLRYVSIDTTANDNTDDYPSSDGQFALGRVLVEELKQMGVDQVSQDERGIVMASVPGNTKQTAPTVVLNSHLDTSPETTGKNVKPQVIRDYRGGDIALPTQPSRVIRIAENPELNDLIGCTLITTDGTTLLGADDKAGLAIIMESIELLCEQTKIPHGPIRVVFTCDEEIGRGVDHVDVPSLKATACYTLDGPGAGQIDVETFSADMATVTIRGVNIHPSIAKGRMINAIKAGAALIERLPSQQLSPETTGEREGFLHPYTFDGGVGEATLRILIRDFDTPKLSEHAALLHKLAEEVKCEFPGVEFDIQLAAQYRNLGDGLALEPRAVRFAEEAFRRLNLPCRRSIIRGGTDGSRFTELGLPTPNLSSGQHNPHSVLEWACLDEMAQAVRVNLELFQVWAESKT